MIILCNGIGFNRLIFLSVHGFWQKSRFLIFIGPSLLLIRTRAINRPADSICILSRAPSPRRRRRAGGDSFSVGRFNHLYGHPRSVSVWRNIAVVDNGLEPVPSPRRHDIPSAPASHPIKMYPFVLQ